MAQKKFFLLREIATRWGCCHTSVLTLVQSGALPAVDISTNPRKRSRYIVPTESLEAFEEARTVTPPERPAPHKRQSKAPAGTVIKFFD